MLETVRPDGPGVVGRGSSGPSGQAVQAAQTPLGPVDGQGVGVEAAGHQEVEKVLCHPSSPCMAISWELRPSWGSGLGRQWMDEACRSSGRGDMGPWAVTRSYQLRMSLELLLASDMAVETL